MEAGILRNNLEFEAGDDFEVWGVVVHLIRTFEYLKVKGEI